MNIWVPFGTVLGQMEPKQRQNCTRFGVHSAARRMYTKSGPILCRMNSPNVHSSIDCLPLLLQNHQVLVRNLAHRHSANELPLYRFTLQSSRLSHHLLFVCVSFAFFGLHYSCSSHVSLLPSCPCTPPSHIVSQPSVHIPHECCVHMLRVAID